MNHTVQHMEPRETLFSSSSSLRIHLLGQFKVYVEGQVLPDTAIKGRKARSLLKLLALQRKGRLVRDQAMDALWPDLDANAAASQLYKALHYIRKALARRTDEAGDWVEITDDLIRLVPPGGLVTDAQVFEETARKGLREARIPDLEMAVSVYAGELLPMDLYAPWSTTPREHYNQLYLDVLTALAAQYEQRGELSEAAEMWRLALEKDPVLESAHRGLMRVFARRGQITRALRQFDRCREVLREELDMAPSPETQQTLEDVRERRLVKERDPGVVRATVPGPLPPIINRAEECATIDRLLDQTSEGQGNVLIIRGRVGMGKTRLVEELMQHSRRRGLRLFSSSARESEDAAAYGVFVELLGGVLHAYPSLQDLIPEELGRLVPSFSGRGVPIPHADKLAAQSYLFAQVHRFFAQLAGQEPAVIVLEDLHAADEGSRKLFSYLVRHGGSLPILFVATVRDEAGGRDLPNIPRREDGSVTVMELGPLSSSEHASLLRLHASTAADVPELTDRIYGLSEGNPLFALELLRYQASGNGSAGGFEAVATQPARIGASAGQIPPSLQYVVEQQLEGLSPSAHHLLYIAAVIGRHVPYELITSVWSGTDRSDETAIFDALEEVTQAHLLEERGLDYVFRHALVREAIYTSISEARRRALHARVARRLVAAASDEDEEPVEQIAHHLIRAGERWEGIHYLLRAAERAQAAYAHEDALQRYHDTLTLLEEFEDSRSRRLRRDVLERLGDAYRACGRLEQSYDAYSEAVSLAEELPLSDSDLVELHRKIAVVAIFRTEMGRSETHLERAFELVDDDAQARARLLITKALHCWHLNQLERAYELAQQALALAESVDAKAEASQACEILAMACLPLGRWEEGMQYEMRRQVYGWSPEIVVATDAHLCLWEYHVGGDQPFQKARSFLESVAEQATELGDLRCVAVCHYALGTMHLWRGQSQQAVEELEASLELHDRVGSPAGMAYALARKGVLHTLQGAAQLGWQAVEEGISHAEQASVRDHCLQRLYGVGIWNRLEAGDRARAQELVDKSTALLDEAGACGACALELYPWLAYFYLRSGDMERARQCGDALAELASTTGNPIAESLAAIIESSHCMIEQDEERAQELRGKAFERAQEAIMEASHSPVVYYLDRMVDQQEQLRVA